MIGDVENIFCDDKLSLNNYNLSYDFFKNIGINIKECSHSKIGFNLVDENDENYSLIKILDKDLCKYNVIFEMIKIHNKSKSLYKEYFFDSENKDHYIIFKLGRGIFKKWNEIKLDCILNSLVQFYENSKNALNKLYKFKNYMEILTLGNEIKFIDKKLTAIKHIDKIIFLRKGNFEIDKYFCENKNDLKIKLLEAREFFISKEFRSYCEDCKNIRFIHGNISNKSFLFNEEKISVVNFYNSSVDLFAKDIAIFIKNSINYFENFELNLFVRKLLNELNCNDEFYFKLIKNYLNIYRFIFSWFEDQYFKISSCNNIRDKIKEIDFLNKKQDDLVKNYL